MPQTDYLYTARLRQAGLTSDYGSFWNGTAFTTSYSVAGHTDDTGTLKLGVVLKPGSATNITAIRLRFKPSGETATPPFVDVPFTPTVSNIAISGKAYHAGALVTDGWVELRDSAGGLVSKAGIGGMWGVDLGTYQLPVVAGTSKVRLLDSLGNQLFESESFDIGTVNLTKDLDPPPPPDYSKAKVFLSEVLPDPVGDDATGEFIELVNRGDSLVDIGLWKLKDLGGTEYILPAGTVINPGEYLSIPRAESKITLNNDGDTVTLIDPNGEGRDQAIYTDAPEGSSWSFDLEKLEWSWSGTPTPGATNAWPPPPPPPPKVTIAEARNLPPDSKVVITGTVTAPTDLLGSHITYIQDATGGMQIYSDDFSAILGQILEVVGILGSFRGERRLKATGATVLGVATPPEASKPDKLPDESLEGQLVTYSGTVTKLSGTTIWINAPPGLIKVVFRSSIGWKRPSLKVGYVVTVTGVVSQYETESDPLGYRILPRIEGDFSIIEIPVTAKKTVPKTTAKKATVAKAADVLSATKQVASTTTHPNRELGFILEGAGIVVLLGGIVRAVHASHS